MSETIAGIKIPGSQMAKDLTELIRDKEPDLLYHHSRRVYLFGALTGQRIVLCRSSRLAIALLAADCARLRASAACVTCCRSATATKIRSWSRVTPISDRSACEIIPNTNRYWKYRLSGLIFRCVQHHHNGDSTQRSGGSNGW
jgi:hypothetical protein